MLGIVHTQALVPIVIIGGNAFPLLIAGIQPYKVIKELFGGIISDARFDLHLGAGTRQSTAAHGAAQGTGLFHQQNLGAVLSRGDGRGHTSHTAADYDHIRIGHGCGGNLGSFAALGENQCCLSCCQQTFAGTGTARYGFNSLSALLFHNGCGDLFKGRIADALGFTVLQDFSLGDLAAFYGQSQLDVAAVTCAGTLIGAVDQAGVAGARSGSGTTGKQHGHRQQTSQKSGQPLVVFHNYLPFLSLQRP